MSIRKMQRKRQKRILHRMFCKQCKNLINEIIDKQVNILFETMIDYFGINP